MRGGTTTTLQVRDRGTAIAAIAVAAFIVLAGGAVAAWGTVGSDAWWPVALGDAIRAGGVVPEGIPFAAAPTQEWVNTTVVGQLVLSVSGGAGTIGMLAAQCISVSVTLALLALDAFRRGGTPLRICLALGLLVAGAAPALLITRMQLLSLMPYALLLVVLRREQQNPSAGIWLVPLLLAVWGNLHGAVLIGVAVSGCYLVFSRLRVDPLRGIIVGIACLLATCANPGLLRAPSYYLGVLSGEATSDPSGMWGRLDLGNPFDLAMLACTLGLLLMALRRHVSLWEWVTVAGLGMGALVASRNGIWLLTFLVGLAAAPARGDVTRPAPTARQYLGGVLVVGAASFLGAAVLLLRAPALQASDRDVQEAAQAAAGRVVLAPEPLSEQLAAAGAKIWVSNPLDAFHSVDQAAYLAFLRGDSQAASRAFAAADSIITWTASTDLALYGEQGFHATEHVGSLVVLTR